MTITKHLSDVRPTDERIAEFEALIKGPLPEDYKTFLKRENGGVPKPRYFQFKTRDGSEEDSGVHYFFGLHDGDVGHLEQMVGTLKGRIPAGYVPIATDEGGNIILLRFAGQNPGKVYFWDHEKEEDLPTLKNMSLVAATFSEFVDGLDTL